MDDAMVHMIDQAYRKMQVGDNRSAIVLLKGATTGTRGLLRAFRDATHDQSYDRDIFLRPWQRAERTRDDEAAQALEIGFQMMLDMVVVGQWQPTQFWDWKTKYEDWRRQTDAKGETFNTRWWRYMAENYTSREREMRLDDMIDELPNHPPQEGAA